MIHSEIETILNQAFNQANRQRHEFFTSEHLLMAICEKDTETRNALIELNVDIEQLISNLKDYIEQNVFLLTSNAETTVPTTAFHRIIDNARLDRTNAGKTDVNGMHLIIALMQEKDCYAVYFLQQQGISRLDLIKKVSQRDNETHDSGTNTANEDDDSESIENPLEKYCVNLNEQAKKGKIDPLIGREKELQRTIQTLCRRRKNNPVLVGEAGVGKTAIAEGLAKAIVESTVPQVLQDTVIYSVDLGSMVAGSKYRGDFEKRIKSLIKTIKEEENSIIFIDEIHTILGAGSTSENTLDAANLLKPALSSGELRCIGATTYQEYAKTFEKNAALARRFQKIDIVEPSKEDTIAILQGLKPQFEEFHQVKYSPSAISLAVELADKYIHDRHLPDKAIDIIDEAGAKARIQTPPKKSINNKDIESVLAQIAKIPAKTVSTDDKRTLKGLELRLKKQVFGQDKAINALAAAIKLSRAGLKDIEKPIGSFLFTGPTGVGKTEVSRCLAQELGITFLRFDMSEYMESHSVAKLIGSPPGYVGYDEGGLLTEAVSKTPHCVLLLDEIEKAHPDVFNILLQVMDYGQLTDTNGKKVNFSNVILIMTSNAGASGLEKNTIGFSLTEHIAKQDTENAVKRVFSPEFRNRLSDIITFDTLSQSVILHIIDKLIDKLSEQLKSQKITIKVSRSAKQWLLANGYNQLMGARPMQRLIDKHIKQPLSEKILFGNLRKGGVVHINHTKGNKHLSFECKKVVKV